MKNRLTIAIQKKGRLSDQSVNLIKKSGINFSSKGDNLLAKSNNLPIDLKNFSRGIKLINDYSKV